MKTYTQILLSALILLLVCACAVKAKITKNEPVGPKQQADSLSVPRQLQAACPTCKLSVCSLADKRVYVSEMNAYDAPVKVYDANGKLLVNCDYRSTDTNCKYTNCEIVFVPAKNIWGLKATDKYGFGQ